MPLPSSVNLPSDVSLSICPAIRTLFLATANGKVCKAFPLLDRLKQHNAMSIYNFFTYNLNNTEIFTSVTSNTMLNTQKKGPFRSHFYHVLKRAWHDIPTNSHIFQVKSQ